LSVCLLLVGAEASAVGALILAVQVSMRVGLMAFFVLLLVQSSLTLNAIKRIEKARAEAGSIDSNQRALFEISLRLCLMACTAWVEEFWCLFLFLTDIRDKLKNGLRVWYPCEGMDEDRCLEVVAASVYHIGFALVVTHQALRVSSIMRRMLTHSVLPACLFAEVPESARKQGASCAVCLTDFESGDLVLPLPCRHIYHAECLGLWLLRSATCPMRCKDVRLQLPESPSCTPYQQDPEAGGPEGSPAEDASPEFVDPEASGPEGSPAEDASPEIVSR